LPAGDADIPGSIVYAAVMRAFGQLNDRSTLDFIFRAAGDFDPYVRTQTFEALRRLDPLGEDMRSRIAVREALNDPRDSVVRIACQLAAQYHDGDTVPALRHLAETRPEFTASVYDALRQLDQTMR
jgi:HEAT repeat protein